MRLFSLLLSVLGLTLLAPIMVISMAVVKIEDRGPALFHQIRAGLRGRVFRLHKIRSMKVNDVDPTEKGDTSLDDPLVTRTGRVFRRLQIDELPQLWNILVGDMNIVGPRPVVPKLMDRVEPWQRRRLQVRPGLTGWAQVNGNTLLAFEDRFALDTWYVDHRSFWLDMRIIWMTILVLLRGHRVDDHTVEVARAYCARWSS